MTIKVYFKNDYVKNSGYRYIDFAKEVLDYERKEKTRNSDGLQAR